jgi:hypothetical protein
VAQAFEWTPRVLRHEVLIEAQNLPSVTVQECLRDGGGDPECHSASAALIGEIHAAMVALCDDPSIRRCRRPLAPGHLSTGGPA